METLLKTIVVIIVAFLAIRFISAHRRAQPAAGASPTAVVQASANGFVPLPAPFTAPADRLLILAPPNCPSAEGQRADALVRGLNRDGIPCVRSGHVSVTPTRMPTAEEMARIDAIMTGPVPIVFVNGRVRNNPSIAEIESEYRANSR